MIWRNSYVVVCLVLAVAFCMGCNKSPEYEVEIAPIPVSSMRGQSLTVSVVSDKLPDGVVPIVTMEPMDGLTISNILKATSRKTQFILTVATNATPGKRVLTLEAGDAYGESEFEILEEIFVDTDTLTDSEAGTTSAIIQDTTTASSDTATAQDTAADTTLPTIEVRPSSIFTGEQTEISIFGKKTHFSALSKVTFPEGAGLTVLSTEYEGTTLTDGELIVAMVSASADATPEAVTGTVTGPWDTGVETAQFSIQLISGPRMSVMPSGSSVGQKLPVTLTGVQTHFSGNTPATLVLIEPASQGVSIDLDSVDSNTMLGTTVSISDEAIPGEYTISAATILESGETETVYATFTVNSAFPDTAGQDSDSGTAVDEHCSDFTVVPGRFSVGAFDRIVQLGASTEIDWTGENISVSLAGENPSLYLGDLKDNPENKCYASTEHDISCSLYVGMQATPGVYEIHVTSDGVTSCGKLTVTSDDIGKVEIPSEYLPAYNTYVGNIDSVSNPKDIYEFNVSAGTTAVFHVVSMDRDNMDPFVSVLDPVTEQRLFYRADETTMGLDARMAHYFAEDGNYCLAVESQESYSGGGYELYTYLLTHGNTSFEVKSDNNTFETAQIIDVPTGSVIHATMDTADDVDYYYFETTGPATIQVAARRYAWQNDSFPDTRLTLYDDAQLELDANSSWYETPSTNDPRLFVRDAGSYYVKVEAEESSSGFYVLNIRPYLVINEIDNTVRTSDPWIELQGASNEDLADYDLCTFDGNGDPTDVDFPCVNLTGYETDEDGYLVINATDFTENTLMLPEGAGAVSLLYHGEVMDRVQFGEIAGSELAEGEPADVGTNRVIGRAACVDSNNNSLDFMYMASPTPGISNDRTFLSAVPLYGEPVD